MTTSHTKRNLALQLELPLPPVATAGDAGPAPDWRLDDETRRRGRRGIAAARALLGGPKPATGAPGGRDRRTGSWRAA